MAYGTINADLMTTSDGVSSSGLYGFKNRIINGAMVIDQRNAGASVTLNSGDEKFIVDRFSSYQSTGTGVVTGQQSSTAPTGFTNSVKLTTTTANASLSVAQRWQFLQQIEGYNTADLAWGTASAKTVTLSFWVYSSLTGTFAGSLTNSAADRSNVFNYTISSANTWEQKTVTITGDTSGTWLTTSGTGIKVYFSLGAGTNYNTTAGAWASGFFVSTSGAVSVVGTNGATFYITGVQLEKGSTATSFDYRPYGTELALCQRYFTIWNNSANLITVGAGAWTGSAAQSYVHVQYPVAMRTSPTFLSSGTCYSLNFAAGADGTVTSVNNTNAGIISARLGLALTGASGTSAGNATVLQTASGASNYVSASAEL